MSWCREIFTHFFAFQKKNESVFVSQWRCKASVPDGTCGKCSCMCIMVGRSASGQPHWLQKSTGWDQPSDERNKVPIWVQQKMIFVSPNLDINHMESQNIMIFVGKHHVIFLARTKINSFLIEKKFLVKHHVIFGAHVIIESLKQLLPKANVGKKGRLGNSFSSAQAMRRSISWNLAKPKPPIVVEHLI